MKKVKKINKFHQALADVIEKSETFEPVKIVETRRDPEVITSVVVRTEKHGCFLVQEWNGYEVLDTFELEEGQKTLRSLKSGPVRFF